MKILILRKDWIPSSDIEHNNNNNDRLSKVRKMEIEEKEKRDTKLLYESMSQMS